MRTIKKKKVSIDRTVEVVCIDDFALKKRHRYGTVMINSHTHQLVDMLPSRDQEKVGEWLKTFANLTIVIRDGAIFFRNAIKEAYSEVNQIADRFHVIQSLTRHAEKAICSLLPKTISQKPPEEARTPKTISQKQKELLITSVRELRAKGLSLSVIG